jgi:hypothetical protein
MQPSPNFTNLQLELLKVFSFDLEEKQLNDVRELLTHYFAKNLTKEMDKLWDEQSWTDGIMQEWSNQHLRTSK